MPQVLTVIIPDPVYKKLEEVSNKKGIRKEDIFLRGVIKALEEFGGER